MQLPMTAMASRADIPNFVIPAKAGTQILPFRWVPAFAGMATAVHVPNGVENRRSRNLPLCGPRD